MGSAVGGLVGFEFRHLLRQGVFFIYLFVVAVLAGVLRLLPVPAVHRLLPLLLYMEPTVVGFIIAGGLFFIEGEQNLHAPRIVSIGGIDGYVRTKIIVFALFAAVASALLVVGSGVVTPIILVAGTISAAVASVPFTAAGLIAAGRFRTVNTFIIKGVILIIPAVAPLPVYLLGVDAATGEAANGALPGLAILPGGGFFLLFHGVTGADPAPLRAFPGMVQLAVLSVLLIRGATRSVRRAIIREAGDG